MDFKERILSAPKNPGIYKMFDFAGNLLYVGKAKNLINRLKQYTDISKLEYHKIVMMPQVAKVEWVITDTEKDALVLEQHLIKAEHPKYNIVLKDDKMYPFLALSKHEFPRLFRFRDKTPKEKNVFGPFPFVSDLDNTIKLIQKVCKIRTCTDSYFSAHSKRPCILYQTGRCSAPCCKPQTDYKERVKLACNILTGKNKLVGTTLKKEMKASANALDFEAAKVKHEQLMALQSTCKPDDKIGKMLKAESRKK